MLIPYR